MLFHFLELQFLSLQNKNTLKNVTGIKDEACHVLSVAPATALKGALLCYTKVSCYDTKAFSSKQDSLIDWTFLPKDLYLPGMWLVWRGSG